LTFRFPGVDAAGEDRWQEDLIRHLGVKVWDRRDIDDEWDLLGPSSTEVLLRYGSVWPPNAFVASIAAQAAEGGSLVTGSFGDELFQPDPHLLRIRSTLERRGRTRVRDILRLGLALSPAWLRRRVTRHRLSESHVPVWLARELRPTALAALARESNETHLRWDTAIRAAWRSRYTQVVGKVHQVLVAGQGSLLVAPFDDPRFRVAFGRIGGPSGFRTRAEAMREVFTDLLPSTLLERPTKAAFGEVFWNRRSHEFATEWSGEGLDPRLVDVETLRRVWTWDPSTSRRPDGRSAALFQAAWLANIGRVTPVSQVGK
jgi:hypothetical protein